VVHIEIRKIELALENDVFLKLRHFEGSGSQYHYLITYKEISTLLSDREDRPRDWITGV